jgi:flagellar biosynthesis protein FlhA
VEIGYALIPLVDKDKGADLLERMQRIRSEAANELGLVIPKIRIIDNMTLDPSEYCIKIDGVDVGRGKIRMGSFMCINPASSSGEMKLSGEATRDPAFGLPAIWISSDKLEEAEREGYTVVDPPSIIATHLTQVIRSHAAEILSRQDVARMLDKLREKYPAVVSEAEKALPLGAIQKVVQNLLREQVSIRNMTAILEAVTDYAPVTKDIRFLTEKARQAVARQLCMQFADDERILHILALEPSLEQKFIDTSVERNGDVVSAPDPVTERAWLQAASRAGKEMREHGWPPVIMTSERARYIVRSSLEKDLPDFAVLSANEVVNDITVVVVGQIDISGKEQNKTATEAVA